MNTFADHRIYISFLSKINLDIFPYSMKERMVGKLKEDKNDDEEAASRNCGAKRNTNNEVFRGQHKFIMSERRSAGRLAKLTRTNDPPSAVDTSV